MKLSTLLFENRTLTFEQVAMNLDRIFKIFRNEESEQKIYSRQRMFLEANGFKINELGSSREVFVPANENFVVKFSVYDDDQNVKEIHNWECAKENGTTSCVAPILDYAENYYWIIMEKAKTFKGENYEILVEVNKQLKLPKELELSSLYDLYHVTKEISSTGYSPKLARIANYLKEPSNQTKWFRDYVSIAKLCNAQLSDIQLDNWGLLSDGRLVLIDYGI